MAWTADDLIAAVRRRAQLPDAAADGAVTDADLLEMANEELALHLVPLVRASREDYWTTYEDQTIVAGTAAYRVPWRAQASGLRDVAIVDSTGREWPLARVVPGERGLIQARGGSIGATVFVMDGPDVRLVPTPTESGYTLRLRYHRAHPTLVLSAATATVANVDGTLAWQSEPETFVAGVTIDVLWRTPPFGVAGVGLYVQDVTPAVGYDLLQIADWSTYSIPLNTYFTGALAGESDIVDLPRECWPLLVSAVTARVLEVIGDRDGAQMAIALFQREKVNVASLLEPRVEGAKVKIVDRNSPLRRGGRRW